MSLEQLHPDIVGDLVRVLDGRTDVEKIEVDDEDDDAAAEGPPPAAQAWTMAAINYNTKRKLGSAYDEDADDAPPTHGAAAFTRAVTPASHAARSRADAPCWQARSSRSAARRPRSAQACLVWSLRSCACGSLSVWCEWCQERSRSGAADHAAAGHATDQPIAPHPHVAQPVVLVAVGVGIA